MICNKNDIIISSKNVVMVTLILIGIASCGSLREDNSVVTDTIKVIDPGKDTVFSIANKKQYDAVNITLEGMVSDTVVIGVANNVLFDGKTTFFVPTEKISFSKIMNLINIKSDSLYIRYRPIRKTNTGSVKIGVSFTN